MYDEIWFVGPRPPFESGWATQPDVKVKATQHTSELIVYSSLAKTLLGDYEGDQDHKKVKDSNTDT